MNETDYRHIFKLVLMSFCVLISDSGRENYKKMLLQKHRELYIKKQVTIRPRRVKRALPGGG